MMEETGSVAAGCCSRVTRNLLAGAVVVMLALVAAAIPARAAVNIVDVRTGLHLNKTRLVLDIDRITTYRIRYLETARSEKSPALREIIIDLPKSTARGPVMALARKAGAVGLLQRITVRNIGDAVRFRLFLRRMAGVDSSFPLKPYHGHGYRLVFDLAAVSAAQWRQLTQQQPLTKHRTKASITAPASPANKVTIPPSSAAKLSAPKSSAPESSPTISAE
ncbi:MAG: hypothetical protein GXP02_08025, partial [Alphaproteobacteria bacterium]|nr:hypothetical protein [Alphaproteobacteria bacterium]